jgi:DNA-binding transcriptional LysR family regulator
MVDAGEVGLVVAADAGPRPGHDHLLVAEEPQVVIAAAGHPLAGAPVVPHDLRGSTVLVREHGSTTRTYQLELLEQRGSPRAHGGRHEQPVPLITSRPVSGPLAARYHAGGLRSRDLHDLVLNHLPR